MRAARNLQLYTSIILLFLSTFTAAWPWPRWLPELDSLIVRAENDQSQNSTTVPPASATNTGGSTSSHPQTGKTTDSTGSAKETGSSSGTKATGKATTTTAKHTSTQYDARLPAGGISMITPAIISGPQYYKIGDFVTFAWNYTSLLATPTAVNILATCTANEQLYTLAANQTIGNATGAVTWDTGSYQSTALSDPLLTETYTLIIYDADSSISATAQAGYLAVYDQYTFGMYTPQPYTPLGEFQCATCSGALSDMERKALGMVFGVSVITVLSFTWFVGGLGVIW